MSTQIYLNSFKARRLFFHICAVAPPLKQNCPVGMVIKFWRRGHFCAPHCPVSIQFPPRRLSAPTLATSLADPGLTPRTHSNRIPYASAASLATPAHAMNPDLRDYLARRAIPRCSLRYYRTSPAPNDTHYEPFKSQYLLHHPSPPPSSPLLRPATPRQSLH